LHRIDARQSADAFCLGRITVPSEHQVRGAPDVDFGYHAERVNRADLETFKVSHGRYVTFQLAEVAVSRQMFADILSLIARLQAPLAPA